MGQQLIDDVHCLLYGAHLAHGAYQGSERLGVWLHSIFCHPVKARCCLRQSHDHIFLLY